MNSILSVPLHSDGSLCGLYKLLHTTLSSRKTQNPVCLVLDDLSVLINVGVREREIHSFVKYCVDLVSVTNGLPMVSHRSL